MRSRTLCFFCRDILQCSYLMASLALARCEPEIKANRTIKGCNIGCRSVDNIDICLAINRTKTLAASQYLKKTQLCHFEISYIKTFTACRHPRI